MTFASPIFLVALVIVPVVVVLYARSVRKRAARSAGLATQGLVLTSASARMGKRRHIPFALFTLALAVLAVALGRPETNITTSRREGTVILAFDTSNSMAAQDIEPTRLEAAKVAAKAFVARQPSSIKIGVVTFGDGAVISQQPSDDPNAVVAAIDRLKVDGGTSIGQGLFSSLSAIAGKPLAIDEAALGSDSAKIDVGYYPNSTIVVLSDGENTGASDPRAIAQVASVAGVQINTIGLGTEDGTVVTINGFNIATKLDSALLTDMATSTNGTYYQAKDATELVDVYKKIKLRTVAHTRHTEITAGFAGAGALLMVAGSLLSVLWFGRVV